MELKTIQKEISISAPKERVWDVLLNDESTKIWYAEFSAGTYAITDWQVGSKAVFTDATGNGLISKVVENKPAERLVMEYEGAMAGGSEDYESGMAKAIKGGRESYHLEGNNGSTHLTIACDMGAEYFETMSSAWERALQKIKELAEK